MSAAASKGQLDCVQLLLERGSNINHYNRKSSGQTPLHVALANGHDQVTDFLLRNGANPVLQDAKGCTALDVARQTNNVDTYIRMQRQTALYASNLLVKVPRLIGGSAWTMRYFVVIRIYHHPSSQHFTARGRSVLLGYETETDIKPKISVWLTGARVTSTDSVKAWDRLLADAQDGPAELCIHLHPSVTEAPSGLSSMKTTSRNGTERLAFLVRPVTGRADKVADLKKLMDFINGRPGVSAGNSEPPTPAQDAATRFFPLQTGVQHLSTDEEIARRLQEEEDARMAHHYSQRPGSPEQVRIDNVAPHSTDGGLLPTAYPPVDFSSMISPSPNAPMEEEGLQLRRESEITLSTAMSEESVCVYCHDAPRSYSAVHGDSAHYIACEDCKLHLRIGQPCPMCREPIEGVVRIYNC